MEGRLVPSTPMRKAIARRMTESKQQAPHFYVATEIEMDTVSALITEENARDSDVRVTATAALVLACASALRAHPQVNRVWTDDGLLEADEINVGVAIALDEGLIAPALLAAGDLDLRTTAIALGDLVERARAKKLKPAELSDATFTLSNLGMFDVSSFTAIVTPPQVAILAAGRSLPRLVPDGERGVRAAAVLTATLSADHRALDGTDAAVFLQTLKNSLERPEWLLTNEGHLEEAKS